MNEITYFKVIPNHGYRLRSGQLITLSFELARNNIAATVVLTSDDTLAVTREMDALRDAIIEWLTIQQITPEKIMIKITEALGA